MAFRRKYTGRSNRRWRPRSQGMTAAVASKLARKANKRHHWVTIADTMCSPIGLDCKGCCVDPENPELSIRGCTYDEEGAVESSTPNPYPVVLVSPARLSSAEDLETRLYEPDTLTIAKMEGYIQLCPAFCSAADETAQCLSDPARCPVYSTFARQFDTYHLRAGLSKDRWEWDPLTEAYSAPVRYPLDPEEWSDAQFLRTWDRTREKKGIDTSTQMNAGSQMGCCSDVSAAGAGAPANSLSSGSGTINIPAISTDCDPCIVTAESVPTTFGLNHPQFPCIKLSLNSRRKLTFKENEGLTMWIDWTSYTPFIAPSDNWRRNVGWGVRAFVKALIETV